MPWSGAAEDHQTANVRWLSDQGGAVLLAEARAATGSARSSTSCGPIRRASPRSASGPHDAGALHRSGALVEVVERVAAGGAGAGARSQGGRHLLAWSHRDRPSCPTAAAPSRPSTSRRPLRLHVVGVGGPGMTAIAIALAEMGHTVSGSDLRDQPVLDRVRAAGVDVHVGHDRRTWSPAATP